MELFGEASNKCEMNLHGESNAVRPGELWAGALSKNLVICRTTGLQEGSGEVSPFPSRIPQHLSLRELTEASEGKKGSV